MANMLDDNIKKAGTGSVCVISKHPVEILFFGSSDKERCMYCTRNAASCWKK